MDDIVERLRLDYCDEAVQLEAADEIERLRDALRNASVGHCNDCVSRSDTGHCEKLEVSTSSGLAFGRAALGDALPLRVAGSFGCVHFERRKS